METISPARGLSRTGRNRVRSIAIPSSTDEDQPEHHRKEKGKRMVRVCEHHAVGAEHEQLAVGEVDHAPSRRKSA